MHLLLTGAGFSRNWGGWLATEAFEYLLGCPEVDEDLRHLLWINKRPGGGFEDAFAELQLDANRGGKKDRLDNLKTAITSMLKAMDQAFADVKFEQNASEKYHVRSFLARFDAIFTLNQDLLLERHYLDDNHVKLTSSRRWSGCQIPGTKPLDPRVSR